MKKIYSKPATKIVELNNQSPLLTVSQLGNNDQFYWGSPDNDR